MTELIQRDQFSELLVNQTPLIDVRAPVEFSKGALPSSVNLPLVDDLQREQIGICYKQQGQQAAIELGHQLVSGQVKQAVVDAWHEQLMAKPESLVYCARGGLRSRISQQWMLEAGFDRPRIAGGFKALRQFCLDVIEQIAERPVLMLSGMTGVGKTDLLVKQSIAIDLEGLANHRGSTFGGTLSPQPSQINFENTLATELLQVPTQRAILLEDESRLIGRIFLPLPVQECLKRAPIVLLEASTEERATRIVQQYVLDSYHLFCQRGPSPDANEEECEPIKQLGEHLLAGMARIRKRLGGEHYQAVTQLLQQAIAQSTESDFSSHQGWVEYLLEYYYDPMYRYQLSKKQGRVVFRGEQAAINDYLMAIESGQQTFPSLLSSHSD